MTDKKTFANKMVTNGKIIILFSLTLWAVLGSAFVQNAFAAAPVLSDARVQWEEGTSCDTFTYYVHYYDADGQAPLAKYICINGVEFTMEFGWGAAYNGWYTYTISGDEKIGGGKVFNAAPEGYPNWYTFVFSDGANTVKYPQLGFHSGPVIYTPQEPTQPDVSGETSPYVNSTHDYTAVSTDNNGDNLQYTFEWNDGSDPSVSEWVASGTPVTMPHTWDSPGINWICVTAKDGSGCALTSGKWCLQCFVNDRPPNAPEMEGAWPTWGTVGETYDFSVRLTDEDGDDVRAVFDWGDDTLPRIHTTMTEFVAAGEAVTLSHSWDNPGLYEIVVTASNMWGLPSEKMWPQRKINIHPANVAPVLTNGKVTPGEGIKSFGYHYYVDYTDANGDVPAAAYVYINNYAHPMERCSGEDYNGKYHYGPVSLYVNGDHNYYFYFSDGRGGWDRVPAEPGAYDGPTVVNQNPTAYIDVIRPNPAKEGQKVYFEGHGKDKDEGHYISAYEWKDGGTVIDSSASFTTSGLSAGTHSITFTVTDNKGGISAPVAVDLVIESVPFAVYVYSGDSINAAIVTVATGGTVYVNAGTYTENVDVNKNVTIVAVAGAGSTTVQAAMASDHVFHVTANNVTIDGFTIKGATGVGAAGVYLDDVSGCDIINNDVHSNSRGIVLDAADNNNDGIQNNTVHGNTSAGIALTDSDGNRIADNTVTSNGYGITIGGSSINNQIINNTVDENNTGIGFFGTAVSNTIERNSIVDNTYYGINIQGIPDPSTNVIKYNDISGTQVNEAINNQTTVYIDAEFNWWGDISGPYHDILNPDGSGDEISDYVYVYNWLGASQATKPMTFYVHHRGSDASSGVELENVYLESSSGDIILVDDGNYAIFGWLGINAPVTFRSINGASSTSLTVQNSTDPVFWIAEAGDNVTIEGFTIVNASEGIVAYGGDNCTVRDCIIYGHGYDGIWVTSDSENFTAEGNTIRNNAEYGIICEPAAGNHFFKNNIYDNTRGGIWDSSEGNDVYARYIYYGHSSGPSYNPTYGESISPNVNIDPWLVGAYDPDSPPSITNPLRITTNSTLPGGTVGNAYSYTLESDGGGAARIWGGYSDGLPGWLSLNTATGELSGVPSVADTYNLSVQLSDGVQGVHKHFSVTITDPSEYTLIVGVSGSGSTNPSAGSHTYKEGTEVTITATPGSGCSFDHWEGDSCDTTTSTTVIMNGDRNVTACFTETPSVQHTLAIDIVGGGSTNPSEGTHTYDEGTEISINATPASGWEFDHWGGNASGGTTPTVVTMDASKNVTVYFTSPTPSNNPPNTPRGPSPADNAVGVAVNSTLSWTGGDPDPGNTVTYDVYFGTTTTPPLISPNQSSITYDPGALSSETQYYWYIIAHDNYGESMAGPLWDFTTASASPTYDKYCTDFDEQGEWTDDSKIYVDESNSRLYWYTDKYYHSAYDNISEVTRAGDVIEFEYHYIDHADGSTLQDVVFGFTDSMPTTNIMPDNFIGGKAQNYWYDAQTRIMIYKDGVCYLNWGETDHPSGTPAVYKARIKIIDSGTYSVTIWKNNNVVFEDPDRSADLTGISFPLCAAWNKQTQSYSIDYGWYKGYLDFICWTGSVRKGFPPAVLQLLLLNE